MRCTISRHSCVRSSNWRCPRRRGFVIDATGLAELLSREARFLSHGEKQALELAMVLALEPQIILLDEPTAGLTWLKPNARASDVCWSTSSPSITWPWCWSNTISILCARSRPASSCCIRERSFSTVRWPKSLTPRSCATFTWGRAMPDVAPVSAKAPALDVANLASGYGVISAFVIRDVSFAIVAAAK